MGEEHPVTYISRKLLSNEKNYSTVEKGALAIKWALDKLRYYLLGREFMLVTDNAPLKWMASVKMASNARLTMWFLALQDFRFRVDHRPGREHAIADALSCREACLWSVRDNPRLQPAVQECGKPVQTPWARQPRGEVVDGIDRRYPPVGAREHPLRHRNQRNGEHVRRRTRKTRYPLKGCIMFSQGRELEARVDQGTSRTRFGCVDQWI